MLPMSDQSWNISWGVAAQFSLLRQTNEVHWTDNQISGISPYGEEIANKTTQNQP